jgi:DNA-binding transcriptional MerR regulator
MSNAKENPVRTVERFQARPDAVYTLEITAHLTQVTRPAILVYYNHGLVSRVMDPLEGGYYFNDEAIRALQHIAFLQNDCGINMRGTRIIVQLMDEVEQLQNELRFRRE